MTSQPPYPGQVPGQDPWSGRPGSGQQGSSQPGYPGQQGYPGPQGPGQPGHPGQPGYPGQPGFTGHPGYPGQPGYPAQQGYQPQQGYPSPPSASPYPGPYGGGGEPPQPARPATVNGAFVCWLLTVLASIVTTVLVLNSPVWQQALDEAARQGDVDTAGVDVQGLVNGVKIIAAIVAAVFMGLVLLFAFKMRAGRNWARIVLTVLAAFTILSAFDTGMVSSSVTVNGRVYSGSTPTSWIPAVLAVVALVLMYLPASNRYFSESKRRRAWMVAQGR